MRSALTLALGCLIACAMPGRAGAACTITVTTPVAFGAYDVLSATPRDATGNLRLLCTRAQEFWALVTVGPGGSNNQLARQMRQGATPLGYNLYTNAARTQVWGDGSGGTGWALRFPQRNVPLDLPVYGRIPAGQSVRPGAYADTVLVTVNY
jgi:spore coat protein U-like protein